MSGPVKWARYDQDGYEVSSRGDRRFSPLFAQMPDGRTIEAHYQCDVKGFKPGSPEWRQFKRQRPPGKTSEQLWAGFFELWETWAEAHPREMVDLLNRARTHGWTLTDRFATSDINQAHALSILLNEMLEGA